MAKSLPLLALRAFVEVGQSKSIKAAAQALNVTPGAISQRIRLLETRVGAELFTREKYGVRMTEVGENVYPQLLDAFQSLEKAYDKLEKFNSRPALTINTSPTFAASWLVPRLGHFKKQHPQIEIEIQTTYSIVDLKRDRVDIALRHGLGHYPGLDVTQLMVPVLIPVASPELIKAHQPVNEPIDCLNYPLLQDASRADWYLWLSAHGASVDERAERGSCFEDDFLLIRAAKSGQGIALVAQEYAEDEIREGQLIQVLDNPWPSKFAYYAVSLPDAIDRFEVKAFIDWIKEEAKTS
ncbi:LysR family transcriptional regulator [Xenorhabdus mauleonii]|uniref:LysR family transcriptional regulator n=1 Tax=Xenorhabdus mauleonii TaxID=351675 RepID=A0A1I3PF49_9GAMM|nr:LysR substrate-binding domain-containing protein [Xenorhabdus mauleonii]PHM44826.1 LysR family transcriptional regulator [Xenorhabdus mauleonii]SFJ19977.1 LysR family transcriptional regulator, glycine cleavage system transcriptional activator [Xenorhabdus mauleonii]